MQFLSYTSYYMSKLTQLILLHIFITPKNIGTTIVCVAALMLPSSTRSVEDLAKCRNNLKTYLYNVSFPS